MNAACGNTPTSSPARTSRATRNELRIRACWFKAIAGSLQDRADTCSLDRSGLECAFVCSTKRTVAAGAVRPECGLDSESWDYLCQHASQLFRQSAEQCQWESGSRGDGNLLDLGR